MRALLFVSLGLFGVVPACHYLLVSGWHNAVVEAAMHRVFIQAGLYILGTLYVEFCLLYRPSLVFFGSLWSHLHFGTEERIQTIVV